MQPFFMCVCLFCAIMLHFVKLQIILLLNLLRSELLLFYYLKPKRV